MAMNMIITDIFLPRSLFKSVMTSLTCDSILIFKKGTSSTIGLTPISLHDDNLKREKRIKTKEFGLYFHNSLSR